MTQAVFKQLYNGQPWDYYYNITEFLWGKVNYKGADYIVFQSENELKKCRIPRKGWSFSFINYCWDYASKKIDWMKLKHELRNGNPSEAKKASMERTQTELRKKHSIYPKKHKFENDFSLNDLQQIMEEKQYQTAVEEAKNEKWWDDKWNSLVNELNSQKQLFIAV
jgi:anthranilate/para-aminobenzoate synthase component I